jgi:methylmalonyl-CoA/ethylmalonyl-CoA epimerase
MLKVIPTLPGLIGIHHFALAVPSDQLNSQLAAYQALGFAVVHREDVLGSDQVHEVLLQPPAGPPLLQLLSPLSASSPVARQLDKPRPAFAHLALAVADIHAAYAHLRSLNYQLLDPAPRPGSHGTTVFFVHPKSPAEAPLGYLLEIVQDPTA